MALSFDRAEELIVEFCRTYPQASTINFNLYETQEEIYGRQATVEREGRIYGSYRAQSGRADFAIANCETDEEFRRTLRHEVLGHFGINTFNPREKLAVLEALITSHAEPTLAPLWADVDRLYPALTDLRKAEEVFAFACEAIEPKNRAIISHGIRSFDEACLSRTRPMTAQDLANVTAMVAEGLHDRTRWQHTFPASDSAQFKQDNPPKTSQFPVWLAVPHEDREKVRQSAGSLPDGRPAVAYDQEARLWFAQPGCDLNRVTEWFPDRSRRAGGGDPHGQFLDALTEAGLVIKGMPIMDGTKQRVSTVDGKPGNKSGAYCGFLDGRAAGWMINYHRANSARDVIKWVATGGDSDPLNSLHIRAGARQSQEDSARERAALHEQNTQAAKRLYDKLPGADPAHPYLVRKGIPPTHDLRQTRNGALVVPFFNAQGLFKTLQYIPETGDKYLFKDAPKHEHFLVVGGPLNPAQPILYAEGYATARSLNLATDLPVVMTIDAGNMVAVAKVLNEHYPGSRHLFMADFDHAKQENKGLVMATQAAKQVGGHVLYPAFNADEIARGFTDFNDLHQSRGLDAVREQTASLIYRHDEVPSMQDNTTRETPDAALSADQNRVTDQAGQVVPVTTAQFEPFKDDAPKGPAPEVEPYKGDVPAEPAPEVEPYKGDVPAGPAPEVEPYNVQSPITPESAAAHVLRTARAAGFEPELLPQAQQELRRLLSEGLGPLVDGTEGAKPQFEVPVLWTGQTETRHYVVQEGVLEPAGDRKPEIFSVYAQDHDARFAWVADFDSQQQSQAFVAKLQQIDTDARRDWDKPSEPTPAASPVAIADSANAVPQSAPAEIHLAGVNYSELVLVHATPRMPTVNADGSVDINSAFHNAGGFDQKPDYSQVEGRKPQDVTTRASVHFTLQDPVSDHAYGKFEGREFTIYGRLNSAVEANGAPESLLTSDTAFFAPDKPVTLPDAVVVQLDLAGKLNENEFARPVDGGWLVATAITEQNRSQAEQLLTGTEMNNPGLGALETLTYLRGAENGAAAGAEVSKTLALNSLNAPTINKAMGVRHGSKIGFDGWASFAALETFKNALPVSEAEKAAIVVGRHDSTDGDKLNTYFRVSRTEGLSDITQSKNPAIAAFAGQLINSELHQVMRKHEILAELASEPYVLRDDNGVSSRGMAASIFDKQEPFYQSPKLGQVSQADVLQAIAGAEPAQIQAIQQNLLSRGLHTDDMRNGDAKLAEALGIVAPQQTTSQAPLPGSPGAQPSLGPDVPPPMPTAQVSLQSPLPGSPGAQPSLGPDVPPPMPNAQVSLQPPLPGSPGAQPSLGSDVPPPYPDAATSPQPPLPGSPGAPLPLGADVPPPFPDTVVTPALPDVQVVPEKTPEATATGPTVTVPLRDVPEATVEPAEVMVAPSVPKPTTPVARDFSAEVPELPELPRRSAQENEVPAQAVADTIHVGAPIGKDTPDVAKPTGDIDKDALLARITREPQGDTVLYKLDAEPAFHDRGSRLEMVPGAGQSDEKVMAALLTAAQFYRGQIELTGSDAFKAKAIDLIARHQINVTMKNPVQQMMLDQARERLDVKPAVPEAVHGVTPPPYEPKPVASTVPIEKASRTNESLAPVAQAQATQSVAAQPAASTERKNPDAPAPTAPQAQPARPAPLLDPAVHQSYQAAKEGITGKVISCGPAPFRFQADNAESIHIKLRTKAGTQTFWGRELAGLIRETRIQPGKMCTLQWLGQQSVVVNAPVKENGITVRFEEKTAHRNQWSLALVNGPTVRTGTDEGVKLGAYDASRFAMIQNSVMAQLQVPIEAPVLPRDGLFWMTPNGQGSAKTGDELSAPRPQVDAENAGKLVMSSWSQDGHLDMALFRGDGPYLQGVVRQEDRYQHVLVSLPAQQGSPAMVFNTVTEHGLIPIGTGNGINRSGGQPVQRDHVAFKLEGDAATRIAKLDFPAQLPPALHNRLGFNERYKDDNALPKSPAPAAAPSAKPNEMRPA